MRRFLSLLLLSSVLQACISEADAACSATSIFSFNRLRQVFIGAPMQSNGVGRGDDPIADEDVEFPNRGDVYVYDNNGPIGTPNGTTNPPSASTLDSPTGQTAVFPASEDSATGVGPMLPFADELLETWTNHEVGLIPCGLGGSQLSEWMPGQALYEECRERWQQNRIGDTAELAGLLIYQGEADTQDTTEANAWVTNMVTIVNAIRTDTGRPFLPAVVVRLPATPAEPTISFSEWALLRSNMHRLCDELRWCVMVQAPSGPYVEAENVHLDTTPQITLGRSMADAYETTAYAQQVTP